MSLGEDRQAGEETAACREIASSGKEREKASPENLPVYPQLLMCRCWT